MTARLIKRFWAKVQAGGPEACWLWQGNRSVLGYGRIAGRYAHRVALALAGRPAAPGLVVHHVCEQRACVNPEHLTVLLPGQHTSVHRGIPLAERMRRGRERARRRMARQRRLDRALFWNAWSAAQDALPPDQRRRTPPPRQRPAFDPLAAWVEELDADATGSKPVASV